MQKEPRAGPNYSLNNSYINWKLSLWAAVVTYHQATGLLEHTAIQIIV